MPGHERELLDQWFAAAPAGLAIVDAHGRVVRENASVARIAGRDAAALARHPAVAPAVERALAGETPERILVAAGDRPLGRASVWLLPLDGAVALTVVSVSDHRIAQETLELALEGTDTGTWVWEVAADAIRWSPNLGPLHGLDRGAAPRRYADWLEGIHPEDRDATERLIAAALAGESGFVHEFRVAGGGPTRWLHSRAHVMRDDDGSARVLVGLTTDVTERKRREAAAELLARAGLALARTLDGEEALRQIAALAIPLLADWCTVHLADAQGRPTRIAVAHGDPDRVAWAEGLPARADLIERGPGAVIRTGRSELWAEVDDALLEATAVDEQHLRLLRDLRLTSVMVVPVTAGERTLGAISFLASEPGRRFDETDLALAEELGRRAGLAMENVALHAAQREANQRLRGLQAVTDVALTHLDLDALLAELLARLGAVLDADIAKVLLYDAGRTMLRVRAAIGLPDDAVRGLRVPPGTGAAGRIAAAGRPLVLRDTGSADVVLDHLREPGRSLAGVPLRLGSETLGVLIVSSVSRIFDDQDLELLELVADRAARAIRQSELFQAAVDAALQLQRSLLPEALPAVRGIDMSARYVAGQDGTEVGGDWYDLFTLPDGRLAIVVGDVVGRGLRAAARMGRIRTALHAFAFEAATPAEAVERADRLVAAKETLEFTTLLAVFLDPGTGDATACSAGHLPPLLVDADGARTADVTAGPPLGVGDGPRPESRLRLPVGTTLVAYTDGLVEDRAAGLDAGMERLREVASARPAGGARGLVDRIVERLTEGRAAEDDVAIVAVGRVDATIARSFPAEPAAVAAARHEVTAFAAAHGVEEAVLRDVALAVSEACTNVVVHAYRDRNPGPFHLTARHEGDALEVTIVDEGGGVRPRGDSPGVGLGLQIIARTTECFHVRDAPGGGAELVLRFAT